MAHSKVFCVKRVTGPPDWFTCATTTRIVLVFFTNETSVICCLPLRVVVPFLTSPCQSECRLLSTMYCPFSSSVVLRVASLRNVFTLNSSILAKGLQMIHHLILPIPPGGIARDLYLRSSRRFLLLMAHLHRCSGKQDCYYRQKRKE